jgi:hypothetical protein
MPVERELLSTVRPRTFAAGVLVACALASTSSGAVSLAEKAKESGCVNKPVVVKGTTETYKCYLESGASVYFNVPGAVYHPETGTRSGSSTASATPTPGYPRVDSATQKSRDEMRRKVLSDELSSEEKLLDEARVAYDNGAPAPLPEEKADAEKYRQRIGRLRQAVQLHERNIDALKKELASIR